MITALIIFYIVGAWVATNITREVVRIDGDFRNYEDLYMSFIVVPLLSWLAVIVMLVIVRKESVMLSKGILKHYRGK